MSQTKLTNYFNSRKRPASDDIVSSKHKIAHIDRAVEPVSKVKQNLISQVRDQDIVKDVCNNNTKQVNKLLNKDNDEVKEIKVIQPSVQYSDNQTTVSAFSKKVNASNVGKSNEPSKIETVNLARKELSLGDIRKKLAGSSRLAELRATADSLSKSVQQFIESEKKNLKEFRSIDVDIPQSPSKKSIIRSDLVSPKETIAQVSQQRPLISPRKVIVSPVKSPKKVPAYIRHAFLASSAPSLQLPHHYRFLAELFRSMETAISLLYNRKEKITFNKLKPSVQEMLKRNFTEKHLAQIKNLVPDFYNFEIQKVKNFSTSSHKETYELVISPNFPNDIKTINPLIQLERRRYFYDTLLQVVKKHHAQFLASLDPPIDIPANKLVRWHPAFELEKIPEIECAKLPEMPNAEKYSSAQDVLAKARELFKCSTKMERAMEKLAQAKARGLTEQEKEVTGINDIPPMKNASTQANQPSSSGVQILNKARGLTEQEKEVTGINDIPPMKNASTQANQPSSSGVQILNPALRNLPAALLERVKAKQAAKALEAMTRSTEHEEKYFIYSRLPDLARTLRNIFVTERKNVLALNVILSKLDSSFKSNVSANNLHRDIKLLTEEVPEWIKLHAIRNTTYLKLDRNSDLKVITSKLDNAAAKYKTD